MKANVTKRLVCTLLALAVMITTVFVYKKITGTTPGRYRKGLEKSFDKQ